MRCPLATDPERHMIARPPQPAHTHSPATHPSTPTTTTPLDPSPPRTSHSDVQPESHLTTRSALNHPSLRSTVYKIKISFQSQIRHSYDDVETHRGQSEKGPLKDHTFVRAPVRPTRTCPTLEKALGLKSDVTLHVLVRTRLLHHLLSNRRMYVRPKTNSSRELFSQHILPSSPWRTCPPSDRRTGSEEIL
jgi:hypothetical protein